MRTLTPAQGGRERQIAPVYHIQRKAMVEGRVLFRQVGAVTLAVLEEAVTLPEVGPVVLYTPLYRQSLARRGVAMRGASRALYLVPEEGQKWGVYTPHHIWKSAFQAPIPLYSHDKEAMFTYALQQGLKLEEVLTDDGRYDSPTLRRLPVVSVSAATRSNLLLG